MKSAIPSDLLKLKNHFEAWRKTHAKRSKTPVPLKNYIILGYQELNKSVTRRIEFSGWTGEQLDEVIENTGQTEFWRSILALHSIHREPVVKRT